MAVYTEVSFDDLEALLGAYEIGVPLSFKGIAEGVENSNFHLRTDRGAFILTLYEKRVREDDLPYFLGLMDHLAAHGVPCPTPVRCGDGRLWTRLNDKPAALLSWLDGLSVHRPSVQQCADVASASARLHEAGQGFALSRPNALGPESWRRLVDATSANADRVQPGLAALMAEALGEIDRHWPTGLPGGIIHADLFPDNVLFMEGRLSGLIDFYFACNDAFAYDLAVMLNAWCFESDGSYNITRGKSLIASYAKVRALTAAERDAFPMLARGAALRFLLTRLFDWLNPDPQAFVRPKDPRDFAKRLRFHLKAANAAAYGF